MRQMRDPIFAALLILCFASNGWAQAYRSSVGVPPLQVYKSMSKFADKKNYGKILRSLKVLNPILNHIKKELSENPADAIKNAVSSGDSGGTLLGIRRMIYLDIKDLLNQAKNEIKRPSGNPKKLAKTARLNYELISPYIKKEDFKNDQIIKKSFRVSFRLLGAGSIYTKEEKSVRIDKITGVWSDIITQLDGLH